MATSSCDEVQMLLVHPMSAMLRDNTDAERVKPPGPTGTGAKIPCDTLQEDRTFF